MSTGIKTNRLNLSFQFDKIDTQYDIFEVRTSEVHFQKGSRILDEPLLHENVLSVQFLYGKQFYLLMRHNDANFSMLKELFASTEKKDTVTFRQVSSKAIYPHTLVQLLLYALNERTNPLLKANNLTGHYYCFHENYMRKGKKDKQDIVWQIKAVEIVIDAIKGEGIFISLPVRTFSNLKLQKKFERSKTDIRTLPQYVIGANNTMSRKLDKDSGEETYVIRQEVNRKSRVEFLSVASQEKFCESKMGVLHKIVSSFNKKYQGMAQISFAELDAVDSLAYSTAVKKAERTMLDAYLNDLPIKLIDEIADEESTVFCQELISSFANDFKLKGKVKPIQIEKSSCPVRNCFNIRLIHNREYYDEQEIEDPHQQNFPECVVQHITLEDFKGKFKSAAQVILQELMIKNDVKQGHISCFDWENLGFTESWTFYASHWCDEKQFYYAMQVAPNGTFSIQEIKEDLLQVTKENEHILKMKTKSKYERQVYLVENSKGEVNLIRDTKQFTIPEIEGIYDELTRGNTAVRNADKREELMNDILDIKYMCRDKKATYFVGTIGMGMRAAIATSCHLRAVEPVAEAPLFFEQLLPLMNVSFVKNNQLTVIPFPFKYIREYIEGYCHEVS